MRSINGKSILVVDDDDAMLRALTKVLNSEGGVVSSACWVGEVMEKLTEKQGCFDLIITDLRLPVLGGQSILGAVKASMPEVPVIVITAYGSPELRADCKQKGAAAFLEKPIYTAHLLGVIDRVLSTRSQGGNRGDGNRKATANSKASAARYEILSRLARLPSPFRLWTAG